MLDADLPLNRCLCVISRITSYINNLHPRKHRELYDLIEQVIDASIPLWSMSLQPTLACAWIDRLRIGYRGLFYARNQAFQPLPDAGRFVPPKQVTPFDLRHRFVDDKLVDDGLQVIVKLANIHLTPEKPEYPGGSWHIEGQSVCPISLSSNTHN